MFKKTLLRRQYRPSVRLLPARFPRRRPQNDSVQHKALFALLLLPQIQLMTPLDAGPRRQVLPELDPRDFTLDD